MKYLREISQIITRYREKNLDLLDYDPSPDDSDQISKLYLGLKDGKITTDLAASEYIYGSPTIDSKYTTLKNRLKTKLINLLFFLDIHEPDFSEWAVARYQNAKTLFWVIALSGLGARNSSIKLSESGMKQALRYGFTLNALQFALVLRSYSRFSGSERQYDKCDEDAKRILKIYDHEQTALEFVERLTIRFSRSAAEQPDLLEVSAGYLKKLEELKTSDDSFNFNQYYFRLKNLALQIAQDYHGSIQNAEEAIDYFEKNKHIASKVLFGDFYIQQLSCFVFIQDYEKGKVAAEKGKLFFPEGAANWFVLMEYHFLLEMQTFHFAEAEEVFMQTANHSRYQFLPDETKEKWQLFELYLDFALRQSSIPSSRPERQRIDPKRFLSSVPTFKKDKRGYNVAILLLQVILLLEQNDFGAIISRMDALRTYRNRYLQVGTKRRSALFFKMLQIMEANSFDPKLTALKAKRYLQQLTAQTSDVVEAQEALQILPFEWLWEATIKMLEEKQRQGKIQKMT